MLLFLLICQWRVCKVVCNFQHYFGGRSKRESSCLEIRSSARFLWEIWISYFARRILEGVFVGGIVNIRNECLFSRFMGNESQCGTNKSREPRFICSALRFISHERRKKDTHSLNECNMHDYSKMRYFYSEFGVPVQGSAESMVDGETCTYRGLISTSMVRKYYIPTYKMLTISF